MAHKTIALAIELRERWPYFPILLLPKAKFPGDKRLFAIITNRKRFWPGRRRDRKAGQNIIVNKNKGKKSLLGQAAKPRGWPNWHSKYY